MKTLKMMLVLILCLSMLMAVGCSKAKDDKKTNEPKGTEPVGSEGTEGTQPSGFVNPEGDPFEDTDVAEDPDAGEGEPDPTTEPPVGVIEDSQDEEETDIDLDFGDLLG